MDDDDEGIEAARSRSRFEKVSRVVLFSHSFAKKSAFHEMRKIETYKCVCGGGRGACARERRVVT